MTAAPFLIVGLWLAGCGLLRKWEARHLQEKPGVCFREDHSTGLLYDYPCRRRAK